MWIVKASKRSSQTTEQDSLPLTVTFACERCTTKHVLEVLSTSSFLCPVCGKGFVLHIPEKLRMEGIVESCVLCQCPVYERSDFDQKLGVSVAVAGIIASLIFFGFDQIVAAFGVLGVATIIDWFLYRKLGKVICCYRCEAQYRNYNRNWTYPECDLGLKERYDPLTKGTTEDPTAGWRQY